MNNRIEIFHNGKNYCWVRYFLETPEIYLHVSEDGSISFIETWYFMPCLPQQVIFNKPVDNEEEKEKEKSTPKKRVYRRNTKVETVFKKLLDAHEDKDTDEIDDFVNRPIKPSHSEDEDDEKSDAPIEKSDSDSDSDFEEPKKKKIKKK